MFKGLIIWAQSTCRSTMGLYKSLRNMADFPVDIAVHYYRKFEAQEDNRTTIGLRSDEFGDIPVLKVGESFEKGLKVLESHNGWMHIFCVYQNSPVWRSLICEADRRGEKLCVACEAPCNMESGIRRFLKFFYYRFVLPRRVKDVTKVARCFINYSGDDDIYARAIGWEKEKIIPFGYFPPPLEGSCYKKRSVTNEPFHILSTGILSKYRGADVLIKALKILKDRGVEYRATITQDGELLPYLKNVSTQYRLPVDFPGRVPMKKLIELYETCDVYVGSGRAEPWGMRLNDALNCGAPLVVSTGMGGVKIVRDFGCGLVFNNEDANDLALKLESLIKDESVYKSCVSKVPSAISHCSAEFNAKRLISIARGI